MGSGWLSVATCCKLTADYEIMAVFIAIPLIGFLVILQSAILSQVRLLNGTVDLVLLVLIAWSVQERVKTAWHWAVIGGLLVSLVSALPPIAVLASYLLTTGCALLMRRAFWQRPLLALVTATFLATLITHAVTVVALQVTGTSIPLQQAINTITLPSAVLNLLLAIPIYAWIGDLANWLYPQEIEL